MGTHREDFLRNTNIHKGGGTQQLSAFQAPKQRVHIPRREGLTTACSQTGCSGPCRQRPAGTLRDCSREEQSSGPAATEEPQLRSSQGRPSAAGFPSLAPRPAHNAESPSRGPVVLRAFRLAEMTMGPGSCLCPARAALPVPLGPPLAQVVCPSPFAEPRGAGAPGFARSGWRPFPRVCKFGGDPRAGLGCGVSGNGAPVGTWIGRNLPWDGSQGAGLGPRTLEPLDWPMLHPTLFPFPNLQWGVSGCSRDRLLGPSTYGPVAGQETRLWHFVKSAAVKAGRKLNGGS